MEKDFLSMIYQQRRGKQFAGLCIGAVVYALFGCVSSPSDECSGIGEVVSCLSVVSISPRGAGDQASSDVDALRGLCTMSGDETTPEPFSAHTAEITFRNSQFPTALDSFPITIDSYTITYILTNCPEQASGCPSLQSGTPEFRTLTIEQGATVTEVFNFVPLAVKREYVEEGGEVSVSPTGAAFPSYTAQYVFRGRTPFFGEAIEITANHEFTIGNFDLCP